AGLAAVNSRNDMRIFPSRIFRLTRVTLDACSPQRTGGLLASLNARTSGGLLGGLAAPVEHLDSANHWGVGQTPLRTGAGPTRAATIISCKCLPRRSGRSCLPARALPPLSCLRNRGVNRLGARPREVPIMERG